jgi:Predicted membrane protein (DUF2142)
MDGKLPRGCEHSPSTSRQARRVRLALTVGLAITGLAIAIVLSRSPPTVARSNAVPETEVVENAPPGVLVCQPDEALPGGASAIRVALYARLGPQVSVSVLAGPRTISAGRLGSGWSGGSATIPIHPLQHTVANVKVCLRTGPQSEPVGLLGTETAPAIAASTAEGVMKGRTKVEFLRPGPSRWWSLASSVAQRFGLGRTVSGTWIAYLVFVLMLTVVIGASWLIVATLTPTGDADSEVTPGDVKPIHRIPRAAWACALLACLNAVCWSIIMPPFQVPDEPDHFAYVQQLAETGELPSSSATGYSSEEQATLEALNQPEVRLRPEMHTIATQAAQNRLASILATPRSRTGAGRAGTAASEPPAYYALETIPYALGSATSLLNRLALMRLLSALMAGVTAFFIFMFVRETLPGDPWAWTVGGLAIAVAPLLGFMSGAVNPDAMLVAVAAVEIYCLARAFRRGLTPRLAIVLGLVTGLGLLTKLDFIGLLPGVALGLGVVTVRAARLSGRRAYSSSLVALAVAASLPVAYLVAKSLSHSAGVPVAPAAQRKGESIVDAIGYIWQFYLPRLPGMTRYFPDVFTTRQLWFNGMVGLYGWTDTAFPGWVYDLALVPAGLIGALCARTLLVGRLVLTQRLVEIVVYGLMALGLMTIIGAGSYLDSLSLSPLWWQPRYMLPLFPLLAVVLALAARGAGRRWGPAVGVLIVVLFLAHDIFSQLQVVARYYG